MKSPTPCSMQFPVYVHGMMKMDSLSGVLRPEQTQAVVPYHVPAERLPGLSRLEVRYSPTLAGAMVDALPYMVAYPYHTSDVELDRFLPTVLTQHILLRMGLNLKADPRQADQSQRAGDRRRQNAREGLAAHEDGRGANDQPRLRPGGSAPHGEGRSGAPGRRAVQRRRLGLVRRLWRAILPAYHRAGRARPAARPRERGGAAAQHAGARRRLAQALPGRANGAIAAMGSNETKTAKRTRTRWMPSSTWCWWTKSSTTPPCATTSTATATTCPSTRSPCSRWR